MARKLKASLLLIKMAYFASEWTNYQELKMAFFNLWFDVYKISHTKVILLNFVRFCLFSPNGYASSYIDFDSTKHWCTNLRILQITWHLSLLILFWKKCWSSFMEASDWANLPGSRAYCDRPSNKYLTVHRKIHSLSVDSHVVFQKR